MDLRPGDIVFERSESWFGRAIRWFTRGRYEPPTRINHVGMIVSGRRSGEAEVVEALWRVVKRPLSKMTGAIEVWGLDGGPWQEKALSEKAESYIGRRYGWWKLIAHLIDCLLTKIRGREVYWLRRLLRLDEYPICSWLVAYAYQTIFPKDVHAFGIPAHLVTPDDIHDCVKKAAGWHWHLVYQREAAKPS